MLWILGHYSLIIRQPWRSSTPLPSRNNSNFPALENGVPDKLRGHVIVLNLRHNELMNKQWFDRSNKLNFELIASIVHFPVKFLKHWLFFINYFLLYICLLLNDQMKKFCVNYKTNDISNHIKWIKWKK